MKRRAFRIFWAILWGVCFSFPAWGKVAHPASKEPSVSGAIDRFLSSKPEDTFVVLKNGLTLLIHPESQTQVVAVRVFVRAGSIYEGNALGAGLSHYLEHVVSGGTTRSFTEAEARRRLERLGGATNAYTSHDRTVYYITTTRDHWKDALDLLVSYVTECAFAPEEVAREKAVIQQEFKLGENSPARQLWKLFMKTAYRIHPVRHPVIGYEGVFVKQTLEDLRRYYQRRYRPSNMVVAVAGAVDPDAVIDFVASKTRSIPLEVSPPDLLPQEPPQFQRRWVEKPLPMARLVKAMIGFRSVPLSHEDLYALDVLAILMGEGRTSRLYRRLKDEEDKVLSVSAFNWTPSYVSGQWIVSLTLAPKHWPSVVDSVLDEIRKVQEQKVSKKELEKAKKAVIASQIFGKETAAEIASSLASSYFDTGDPYFEKYYVERIRKVTREDLLRVARRYLRQESMTVVAVLPPRAAHGEGTRTARRGSTSEESSVRLVRLKNGLRVLLKEDHRLPEVVLELYGKGGVLLERKGEEGLALLTASLLTSGTKHRSKQEIAGALESVGGSIDSGAFNNTYFVTAKVLSEDFDVALDVLSDVVRNPTFPKEEIEKKKKEMLLALKRRDENWQRELLHLFRKNYFRKHPYAHDRLGLPETVRSFTPKDIQQFYGRMVVPNTSVLAVYGDFRREEVLRKIQKAFKSWEPVAVAQVQPPDETKALKATRVIEKKTDKTSLGLFVGTNGLDILDPKRPVLDVLDALLSGIGYPGGRLHAALRGGNRDLVYVVHAFPFYGVRGGYFGVITQTTLKHAATVEKIVLEQLEAVTRETVSDEELERAKDMVLTMHHLDLENLEAQAQSAAVNEALGLGFDYDRRYPEMIRAVTAEQVQALAKSLFKNRLIVRTIPVHPEETLSWKPEHPDHIR